MIFQDEDVLGAWKAGQEAHWPRRPELRFIINTRVECRVGPHPVRGWAAGSIVAHFYSEPSWPTGAVAPYQVQLDDGRLIYAPQDNDNVIRLLQTGDVTDAVNANQGDNDENEDEEEYEDDDEMDGEN